MSRIEGTHVAGVLAVVLALLLPNAATAQTSRTIYDAHGRGPSQVGGAGGFIAGYKHAIEYFTPPHTS